MPPICPDAPRLRRRVLAGLLAGPLAACAPITLEQEQQLGYRFEEQMRRELPFVRDAVVNEYVREMGAGLVLAAGPQPFQYSFSVIADDEINAFAGPAGHIYVHTETILRARNASELAGVLAHEIGHVARRHVAQNVTRQRNTQIGADLLAVGTSVVAGGAAGSLAGMGGSLAGMAYLNSFGRDAEREADLFAVEVMPQAGWDPNGLVTFFEVIREDGESEAPAFLSSHPTTNDRIEATRAAVEALPERGRLRSKDGGRLEIIQRRILLLTRRER